jgi:hypothetical protein
MTDTPKSIKISYEISSELATTIYDKLPEIFGESIVNGEVENSEVFIHLAFIISQLINKLFLSTFPCTGISDGESDIIFKRFLESISSQTLLYFKEYQKHLLLHVHENDQSQAEHERETH